MKLPTTAAHTPAGGSSVHKTSFDSFEPSKQPNDEAIYDRNHNPE
jgi:hypothetical protein